MHFIALLFLLFPTTPPQPAHWMSVQWDAPPAYTQPVRAYRVYRHRGTPGQWNLRTTISPTRTSWTDTKVQSGVTYYYVMTAVYRSGESAYSNAVGATIP